MAPPLGSMTPTAPADPPSPFLCRARALEELGGLCRTLHHRLRQGPWKRTRRRLRRQLRKLEATLDSAQRVVLAEHPDAMAATHRVLRLAPAVEQALAERPRKAALKALRRDCKRARHRLEAMLEP